MIKILLNSILGIVLILVWSHFVNIGQIFQTLQKVNPFILLIIFFFMLLALSLRALRFKIFLAEVKQIPLMDLIFLNGVAMMLNFFIPIRAGEIAKGVYLNNRYQINLGKAIVWTFIDRLVDFLGVLLLGAVLFFVVPTSLNITFIYIIIVMLLISLGITYLAVFQLRLARKLFDFLRGLLIIKPIKIYFDKFTSFILESFAILDRHPKDLLLMTIITIGAYGADAAIWYFTFLSLGSHQQYLKMYLGQLLSALTYLIPAAPGYVGSAEASGAVILTGVFGINVNLASAMIVLFHISSAIWVLIFGLISLQFLKLNLGEVFKKAFGKGN